MKNLVSFVSKGERYTATLVDRGDGSFSFYGDMDIDIDGSPDWKRDPYGQPDTTLHFHGHPINGQEIPFIVLPPEFITAVGPRVLGCKALAVYGGRESEAVVGDVGPHRKCGEGSPKLARNLHIDDDPNIGGVDTQSVQYIFWPGVPAVLGPYEFELQSYGH